MCLPVAKKLLRHTSVSVIESVSHLTKKIATALHHSLQCPVCDQTVLGLPGLLQHLQSHLCEGFSPKECFPATFCAPSQQYSSPISIAQLPGSLRNADNQSSSHGLPNNGRNAANEAFKTSLLSSSFMAEQSTVDRIANDTECKERNPSFLPVLNFNLPDNYLNTNESQSINTEVVSSLRELTIEEFKQSPSYKNFAENQLPPTPVLPVTLRSQEIVDGTIHQHNTNTEELESSYSPHSLSCELCGLVFSTEYFLEFHKEMVHKNAGKYDICCKICNKKCPDVESYREHMTKMHLDRNHFCDFCPRTFKMRSGKLMHTRLYHSGSPGPCQYCNKRFASSTRRNFHESRCGHKHSVEPKPESPLHVEQLSPAENSIEFQPTSNDNFKEFQKCLGIPIDGSLAKNTKPTDLLMPSPNQIKQPIMLTSQSVSENSKSALSNNLNELLSHGEGKSGPNTFIPIPPFLTKNKIESLKIKQTDIHPHPGLPPYFPQINAAVSDSAPKTDPSYSNGGAELSPASSVDFRELPKPEKLQRKSSGRSADKSFECDICKKTFTTKYFMKKHKRLHTGETPYSCDKCGKTFTFQQSYHKHLLYHSDEKPHTCTYCGRSFKELSTLNNHVRIHTGEKPFVCATCNRAFRQRVSYLVHLRIHTGEMPYSCEQCGKTFRYKVSMRSHSCDTNGSSLTSNKSSVATSSPTKTPPKPVSVSAAQNPSARSSGSTDRITSIPVINSTMGQITVQMGTPGACPPKSDQGKACSRPETLSSTHPATASRNNELSKTPLESKPHIDEFDSDLFFQKLFNNGNGWSLT